MDAEGLHFVEQACLNLYEGRDPRVQQEAQAFLLDFENQPDCIIKCRQILDQSQSPYANTLAASTLTKIISRPSCPLQVRERLEIRNYALEYLATRLPLPHFVIAELSRLVCRIVKCGWFDTEGQDNFVLRDLPDEIEKFLQGSLEHCVVGIQLFTALVSEMNESNTDQGLTKHRKTMTSFRDNGLFKIFQVALDINIKLMKKTIPVESAEMEVRLGERVLTLGQVCLSFDFLGTNSDESADDTRTAQLPSSWRDTIADTATMEVYFQMYMHNSPPLSNLAMTCLVQLASARRTLFTNQQRATYLSQLVLYINEIFRTQYGLDHPDNYHEFCRLLSRLKTNFQLSELVIADGYEQCITQIAEFTVHSFASWQWAGNSIHYLLSLWDRLISSIPYVKSDKPHMLEQHSPKITEAYIQSRLSSVEVVLREGLENPLHDIEALELQMRQISVIARCEFETTCQMVIGAFDPLVANYMALIEHGQGSPQEQAQFALLDGQITWLIFIIGAVIGSRTQVSPSEAYDALDADLICRALDLMRKLDVLVQRGIETSEPLNVAILCFLQHFRLSFIGDTVPRHGRLYTRLQETIGIVDENAVLDELIQKIVTNLRFWTQSDLIISKTLALLTALCMGYSSLRRLVKSERVQYILVNHTAEHFPFLNACDDTRHRTTFYNALGRVVSSETTENDTSRFEQFLMPLEVVMKQLSQALSRGAAVKNDMSVCKAMLGAVRDIRGILESVTSKPAFSLMFDWLYPDIINVFTTGVRIWYDDPQVAVPILKCMAEFVTNKNSRLQMHTSSPNGILLFRETSKMLVAYGDAIVTVGGLAPSQLYPIKYKGIMVCFKMLKAALLGDYVNFGVFPLYGDDALDVAFGVFFKLLVSVPIEDLLAFPKLCKAYYSLLVAVCRDHLPYLARLDGDFFTFFARSIVEGIKSVDVQICTQCCTSLDYLLSSVVVSRTKSKPQESSHLLANHIHNIAPLLTNTLLYLLNLVMFEDCKNQWSVSRPLLGLIILHPPFFEQAKEHVVSQLPDYKHGPVLECFTQLMAEIEDNLSSRNRDRFTQNLAVFRRDINNFAKSAASGSAGGNAGSGTTTSGVVGTSNSGGGASGMTLVGGAGGASSSGRLSGGSSFSGTRGGMMTSSAFGVGGSIGSSSNRVGVMGSGSGGGGGGMGMGMGGRMGMGSGMGMGGGMGMHSSVHMDGGNAGGSATSGGTSSMST